MFRSGQQWVQRLSAFGREIKRELTVYRFVLKHPLTPTSAKAVLGVAVLYLMMPFDLIPDFIPIIGHLDDAVIVPGLVLLALRMIPKEVIAECREQARHRQPPRD